MRRVSPLYNDGSISLRLLSYALLVGLVAGAGAVIFRDMIALIHNLAFFGTFSADYDANVHTAVSPLGMLIILVPVIGGLVVAFLVSHFAPEAKGHGVPEVIDAIYYKRGLIRPVVAVVKSVASAISIGSGGAVGREGPIIQIGAAFGSTLGQWLRASEWQRITLIACGAGGGIAATFNTPIGGVLFAMELIMSEISARTMVPVVLSTFVATSIGRLAFGDHPSFIVPALQLDAHSTFSLEALALYALFGILLGLAALVFIRAIYGFEDLFDRIPGNYYLRHGLGMLLVGSLMYYFVSAHGHYYIQGVGYATIQDILNQGLSTPWFLLLLFAAKLLATGLTLGSGASGGIFSPALFTGATLGSGFALLVNLLIPGMHLDPVAGAVIGMAGMVAGTTSAVMTGIVMIMEMTRDYHVILPLMVAVALAYATRRALMKDSIYSMKLSRRGSPIPESQHTPIHMLRTLIDLAETPFGDAAQPATPNPRLHQIVRKGSEIAQVWPAHATAPTSAIIALPPDLPVFEALGLLRNARAEVILITADGTRQGQLLGILTLEEIAYHIHYPLAYLQRGPAPSANGQNPR